MRRVLTKGEESARGWGGGACWRRVGAQRCSGASSVAESCEAVWGVCGLDSPGIDSATCRVLTLAGSFTPVGAAGVAVKQPLESL